MCERVRAWFSGLYMVSKQHWFWSVLDLILCTLSADLSVLYDWRHLSRHACSIPETYCCLAEQASVYVQLLRVVMFLKLMRYLLRHKYRHCNNEAISADCPHARLIVCLAAVRTTITPSRIYSKARFHHECAIIHIHGDVVVLSACNEIWPS